METTSRVQKIRKRTEPRTRRKGNPAKPAKKRTRRTGEYGFLNHPFGTLYQLPKVDRSAEANFFESAKNLCAFYGLAMPDYSGLPYPANISFVHSEIDKRVKKDRLSCFIGQDKTRRCCLAMAKSLYTGHTLFYIPLRPFWLICQQSRLQPLTSILCAIYHYLYKVADIAYCGEGSFVGNTYQSIQSCIEDDPDEEEPHDEEKAELEKFFTAVADIEPMLQSPFDPERLDSSIADYKAVPDHDTELIEIAEEVARIASDFPGRSISSGIPASFYEEDPDHFIYMEEYISFYWSGWDSLSNNFFDMIECDLQEKCETEEPVSIQWFDEPQQAETFNFDFETRLFSLLDKLARLLNTYDNEESDN